MKWTLVLVIWYSNSGIGDQGESPSAIQIPMASEAICKAAAESAIVQLKTYNVRWACLKNE